MIYSMTGFGKAVTVVGDHKLTVEVKSLNSKVLDLILRSPHAYRSVEAELRSLVDKRLQRGKVEVMVTVESTGDGAATQTLNLPVLRAYKRDIERISAELDLPLPDDWYTTLLRLPDILTSTGNDEVDEKEKWALHDTLAQALDNVNEFRSQEGKRLEAFFEEKIEAIQRLLTDEVPVHEAPRTARVKARMMEALAKIGEGVSYDNNRLEQELIFYIERLDITEEKIRLQNHLNYFLQTLRSTEPGQGKKLGFISQEMGREINTMGSKANEAELQKVVVRMKDHLEQIKEQVLNVL